MPEVRRGSNLQVQSDPALTSDDSNGRSPVLGSPAAGEAPVPSRPLQQTHTRSADEVPVTKQVSPGRRLSLGLGLRRGGSAGEAGSQQEGGTGKKVAVQPPDGETVGRKVSMNADRTPTEGRRSLSYALRPQADAYYDSRAGTQKEYRRRAKDLEEYYEDNPDLLPQLPFTWKHGPRRWRLWAFAFLVFVDASAIPIALYYGMKYAGDVEEWIIFAVVTTIWGGPTYLEFAIRTLRLIKAERFYRPLGTQSRWAGDMLNWASVLTIFVVTTLFIVGSAPHDTWLRVVAMAAPSILWCLGGVLFVITMLHQFNIPAPCRISSTGKGEKVLPGVYYFIEDVVAVNAKSGRPFREALAARYRASPRFRQMIYQQSMFWSIPSLILATILTVIAVIPWVPENWSYGVCWVAPFIWAFIWACISIPWCKRCMVRERLEWEASALPVKNAARPAEESSPPPEALPPV